jgi:hypothetical protein
LTDVADTTPAPRQVPMNNPYFANHRIYICCAFTLQETLWNIFA